MKDRESLLEALFERDLQSHFGSMMSGFVHNINGPLHNISLLVERVGKNQRELGEIINNLPAGRQEALRNLASNQEQRIQQLTQQVFTLIDMVHGFRALQDMVRNQPKVDLRLVLTRLTDMCRCERFVKYEVNVELELHPGLPLIPIPGSKLIPALMHLLQNALYAVREAEKKKVRIESYPDSGLVHVVFHDSGCGFDPTRQNEAFFEMFYVNWPESSGNGNADERHMGLGLYAVRELLAPYGARVSLERIENETRVSLEVPLPS